MLVVSPIHLSCAKQIQNQMDLPNPPILTAKGVKINQFRCGYIKTNERYADNVAYDKINVNSNGSRIIALKIQKHVFLILIFDIMVCEPVCKFQPTDQGFSL